MAQCGARGQHIRGTNMNLYLSIREDSVVIGTYVADEAKKTTDVLYTKHYTPNENEDIEEFLSIKDKDGKYNNKYTKSFMKMTEEEKTEANKTEKDVLLDELNKILQWYEATDYIPLKVLRGNWESTDQRYLDYLAEYEVKHQRAEELKLALS